MSMKKSFVEDDTEQGQLPSKANYSKKKTSNWVNDEDENINLWPTRSSSPESKDEVEASMSLSPVNKFVQFNSLSGRERKRSSDGQSSVASSVTSVSRPIGDKTKSPFRWQLSSITSFWSMSAKENMEIKLLQNCPPSPVPKSSQCDETHKSMSSRRPSDDDTSSGSSEQIMQQSMDRFRGRRQLVQFSAQSDSPLKEVAQVSTSSRRPSGGNSSLEGSRSQTSQSDNRSFRERLRDRFQSVREQASTAVVEANSRSRLRDRVPNHPVVSRFDDLISSDEACYDFFTQVWELDKEETLQHESSAPTSPLEADEVEESEERTKLLTADFLSLRDEWDLLETLSPQCETQNTHTAHEKGLFFIPPMRQVQLEDKLPSVSQPRYSEEEGLYVGTRPQVALRNKHQLEHRIIISGDRRWFGDDGEVITLPDPLRSVPYRPPLFKVISPLLETEYKPDTFSDVDCSSIMTSGEEEATYLLELELISITFTHHPLFSQEHVLAQCLIEYYRTYSRQATHNHEERLARQLEALRQTCNRLKRSLDQTEEPNLQQRECLEKYVKEIQDVRRMQHAQGCAGRKLQAKILAMWNNIKKLRQQQGYSATAWQLHIHRQPSQDPVAERQAWDQLIHTEWVELEEEQTKEYNECFAKYSNELALWRKKLKAQRAARIREQQEAEQRIEADDDKQGLDQTDKVEEELGKEPQAPTKINWAALRRNMLQRLSECFRMPGEPKLTLKLTCSETVEPRPPCPREQERRLAVKHCSLQTRVLYNDQEVCRLDPRSLGPRFEVLVGELLTIGITQRPQSLKVELYEAGALQIYRQIADVYIPIPSSSTTLQTAHLVYHEFSNDEVATYNHTGVGCGTYSSLYPESDNPICLHTSGILTCRTGWGVNQTGDKILTPPEKYLTNTQSNSISMNLGSILDPPEGMLDPEKLREWAEISQLDPNNPNNADFFYLLKNSSMELKVEPLCFRLEPLLAGLDFCQPDDLQSSSRLCLLKLRDRGEHEFRGIRQVPLSEEDISKNMFKAYRQRQTAPNVTLDSKLADPLESHRAWGQRFLQDVRRRVLKKCRLAQQHRQLQDLVTEDQVPDIGTLGLTFMKWLQPKRPLRPIRKERKKVPIQSLGGQEVKIVVNVVRAFDVPIRKDADALGSSIIPSTSLVQGQRFSFVPVRPFVEASFQGVTVRTTTGEGANPTWNQDLQLPLQPPSGDFSQGSMLDIQDALHLHLFDETVVDLLEDDRSRDTNIHQRLERHWLGSLRIPFSTLYHNIRVEGTFKLYSPSVLLGYHREPHHRHFSPYPMLSEAQPLPAHQDATFLTLFITLQPALNPPEPFKEQLESSEPVYVQEHLKFWEMQVMSLFPHRRPKTLVIDISGKSVCVTRFFRPLIPPVLMEGEATARDMAARFVSLIPMVSGSVLFPGLFDVWLTSDQVLCLLSGDSEDHAVLLCCFLLQQGRRVWLLLGAGIPDGPTAYVLEKRDGVGYWLWDSASGQRYDIQETFSPLQKVYCLINDENIWANIQVDEMPARTRYDVNRRSDWWPAFGRNISAPTGSIQPLALEYRPTVISAVQLLQEKIEKHLRDSLMKWRHTSRTLWNRYCVAILRKILPVLERDACFSEKSKGVDHLQELQHILSSHKMCGFPINLPYTNMATIMESVQATGVHFCENPEVEFALAVYVHPYPNNVLSVWVYVASLVRRR